MHVLLLVMSAMVLIGPAADLESILHDLRHPDKRIRLSAVLAVRSNRTAHKAAVPHLVGCLGDPDDRVRHEAAETLGAIGKEALPTLLASLSSPDYRVRQGVMSALEGLGPEASPATATLIQYLEDKDLQVHAATTLGKIGISTLPRLVTSLRKGNKTTRIGAALAIAEIARTSEISVDISTILGELATQLTDPDPTVRKQMIKTLSGLHKEGAGVRLCKHYFVEQDQELRYMTSIALSTLFTDITAPEVIVPVLAQAVRTEERAKGGSNYALEELYVWSWMSACDAFVQVGEPAVSYLHKMLTDDDKLVNYVAASCLVKIGGKYAVYATPYWIDRLNKDDRPPFPAMGLVESSRRRGFYMSMLREIGPDSKEARAAVLKLLASEEDRIDAAITLLVIDPGPVDAIKVLKDEIGSHNRDRRRAALAAISLLRAPRGVKNGQELVPLATACLADSNSSVRLAAIGAMTALKAKSAIDPLRWLEATDPTEEVRSAARAALENLALD